MDLNHNSLFLDPKKRRRMFERVISSEKQFAIYMFSSREKSLFRIIFAPNLDEEYRFDLGILQLVYKTERLSASGMEKNFKFRFFFYSGQTSSSTVQLKFLFIIEARGILTEVFVAKNYIF